MYYETNECCGCAAPGYPCEGDSCSLRHTRHYVCDICGEEIEDGTVYTNLIEESCEGCFIEILCENEGIEPVRSLDEITNMALREKFRQDMKSYKLIR